MPQASNAVVDLFSIVTHRDLKKHCATAIIPKSDLAVFIMACGDPGMPLQHFRYHRTFVPDHLDLSDKDLGALASNGVGKMKPAAQKTVNKVMATFEERRMLSGHMFQGSRHWHFLYFDNRDVENRRNHWIGGPHIHLINWLTTPRPSSEVWDEFTTGNPKMRGALHIRFDERRNE